MFGSIKAEATTTFSSDTNEYQEGEDGWYLKVNWVNSGSLSSTLDIHNEWIVAYTLQVNYMNNSATRDYAAGDLELHVQNLAVLNNQGYVYGSMSHASTENWKDVRKSTYDQNVLSSLFTLQQGNNVEGSLQFKTYMENTYFQADCTINLDVELYDIVEQKVLVTSTITLNSEKDNDSYTIHIDTQRSISDYSPVRNVNDFTEYTWLRMSFDLSSLHTGRNYWCTGGSSTYLGDNDNLKPYVTVSGLPAYAKVVVAGKIYDADANGTINIDFYSVYNADSYSSNYVYFGFDDAAVNIGTYDLDFSLYGVYHDTTEFVFMSSTQSTVNINNYKFVYKGVELDMGIYCSSDSRATLVKNETVSNWFYIVGAHSYMGYDYSMALDIDKSVVKLGSTYQLLSEDVYTITDLALSYITDADGNDIQPINLLSENDTTTRDNIELWFRKRGETEFYRYYGKLQDTFHAFSYNYYPYNKQLHTISSMHINDEDVVEVKYVVKNVDYTISSASMHLNYTFDTSTLSNLNYMYQYGYGSITNEETGVEVWSTEKATSTTSYWQCVLDYDKSVYGAYRIRDVITYSITASSFTMIPSASGYNMKMNKDTDTFDLVISPQVRISYTESSQRLFTGFIYSLLVPSYVETSIDEVSLYGSMYNENLQTWLLSSDKKTSINTQYLREHTKVEVVPNFENSGKNLIRYTCDLTDDPIIADNMDTTVAFGLIPMHIASENLSKCMSSNSFYFNMTSYATPLESSTEKWVGPWGNTYTSGSTSYSKNYFTTSSLDIDGTGQTNSRMYAIEATNCQTSFLYATQSSSRIKVKTTKTAGYVMPTANITSSSDYSYKLLATTSESAMTNIILYANLEYEGWQGKILGFDLTELNSKGYTANIYTSTEVEPDTIANAPNSWKLYQENDDLSNVHSIAMEFLDATTLAPAVLSSDSSIAGYILMQAPENVYTLDTSSKTNCVWQAVDSEGYVGVEGNIVTLSMEEDALLTVYPITTSISNGTITASEDVLGGDSKTISYSADTGYYIDSVFVDNQAISLDAYPSSYTFDNISAAHTITVNTKPYLSVTATIDNGSILGADTTVKEGGEITVTFAPNTGYEITQILLDGTDVDITQYANGYTFSNMTANHTISVSTKKTNYYTITATIGHGTIEGLGNSYKEGTSADLTYAVDNGYYIESILVDNQPVSLDDFSTGYTFTDIQANHTLVITTKAYVTLTTSMSNGSITTPQTSYKQGETVDIEYKADTGYYIDSILIDNAKVSLNSNEDSYTFKNLSTSHTIQVNTKQYVTITTSIDSGTITTPDSQYKQDQDVKISYEAPEGYCIDKILVDGKEVSATNYASSYTFKNLSTNHTIEVTTVKGVNIAALISNGEITGTTGIVKTGTTALLAVTPEEGYKISSITINDVEVEVQETITLDNLQEDCVVRVVCEPIIPESAYEPETTTPEEETEPVVSENLPANTGVLSSGYQFIAVILAGIFVVYKAITYKFR
jgi:hypothetical protein